MKSSFIVNRLQIKWNETKQKQLYENALPCSSLTATNCCLICIELSCLSLKYSKPCLHVARWTFPNAPSPSAATNAVLFGWISSFSRTWISFVVLKQKQYWPLTVSSVLIFWMRSRHLSNRNEFHSLVIILTQIVSIYCHILFYCEYMSYWRKWRPKLGSWFVQYTDVTYMFYVEKSAQ